jgi:hypothetical protein
LRALLLATAVALATVGVISGQDREPSITEAVVIPPVFTVGDAVEMRVTLVLPEGKELRPIEALPVQAWLVFQDVKIRHDPPFEHVTIKFVPFAPGEKVLPPLTLGDVILDSLRITTVSVLEPESSSSMAVATGLQPPRDQLPLPHTELILLLAFVLVVILPLAVWRFLGPVVTLVAALLKHLERHRPYHRLVKDSRKLEAKISGLSGPEFYTQLLLLARNYLSRRFGRDVSSYTALEVQQMLGPLAPGTSGGWEQLFHKADVVRFDSRNPDDVERAYDLDTLRAQAHALETWEAPRVDL